MRFESPWIREKGKNFHMGFGLVASVSLTVEGLVFWQLATMATMAKSDALLLRPMLTTFFVGYLCLAVISSCGDFVPVLLCRADDHRDIDYTVPGTGDCGRESGGWSGSRKASGRVRDRSL